MGFVVLGASANYYSLKFITDEGNEFLIGLENLAITVEDQNVIADNGEMKLEWNATTLVSMEFSEETAGVDKATLQQVNADATFFNLDGTVAGTFSSLEAAKSALQEGVYVVRLTDGKSLKIKF